MSDIKKIKDSLIDRILSDEQPDMSPTVDSSTTEILKDVINELNKKLNNYLGGPEKVIYDYLNDLENDPNEMINLIYDMNYSQITSKLKNELYSLKKSFGETE